MWGKSRSKNQEVSARSRIIFYQKQKVQISLKKGSFTICLETVKGLKSPKAEETVFSQQMCILHNLYLLYSSFQLNCFTNWFTDCVYCNHFHFWKAPHPLCVHILHFMNFRMWHSNPQISLWVWNTVLWLHENNMTNCILWFQWQICLLSKWSSNWNVHFNL